MYIRILFLGTLLILSGALVSYGQQSTQQEEVIETLDAFHQAIVENDSQAANKLLSKSAKILEGGNIETKDEYLSHHFHSDGKFLGAMNREVESRSVAVEGNTAWVSTQTHTWGTYSDQKLDLSSLELVVLRKEKGTWIIEALHWSSGNN
jgi:ketosteroid isomerase-like protein